MIQANVTDNSGFDLKFLHISLIENLISGLGFCRCEHAKLVEHAYRVLLEEYFISVRNIAHCPQASFGSFRFPFFAITVTFEHYVLRLCNELSDNSKYGSLTGFALGFKFIDLLAELVKTLCYNGVQYICSSCSIGRRAYGTEFKTISCKCERRCPVTVSVILDEVRDRTYHLDRCFASLQV